MEQRYALEDSNILFEDGGVPIIVSYNCIDGRPQVGILSWGSSIHRESLLYITTPQFSPDSIHEFYDNVLSAKRVETLNLDMLVRLAKEHF